MKTNFLKRNAKITAIAWFMGVMLFGSSTVFAQVKIGASPTTIDPTNHLEVESTTPAGMKTSIDKAGKVTIKDGTEGMGRVFTSDIIGKGSWKDIKMTAVTSEQQTQGVYTLLPVSSGNCSGVVGSLPPSCAVDLNQAITFTTTKATNDVIIDYKVGYSIYGGPSSLNFSLVLYVDLPGLGSFRYVDGDFVSMTASGCTGESRLTKIVLKNLPPRTYTAKVYLLPGVNSPTAVGMGIGWSSGPGCGTDNTNVFNKLIATVSE